MTTPHKWAEVIHAFTEGKTIQYRGIKGNGIWLDASSICQIDHNAVEWRIKPEKKTYWVNIYQIGDCVYTGNPYEDKELCLKQRNVDKYIKTISFDIEE